MECSYKEEKLSFATAVYKDEDLQAKVEKVLRHIAWLFEEAQKPDSALDARKIKRVRSTEDLAGKGTSSTQTN